jgi:hypothetical protein
MTTSFEIAAMMRLRLFLNAIIVVLLLGITSAVTAAKCLDCSIPYGFPFAYYRTGGFAGGQRILWLGLAGECRSCADRSHVGLCSSTNLT